MLVCHDLSELFEGDAEAVFADAGGAQFLGSLLHDGMHHSFLREEVSLAKFALSVEDLREILFCDEPAVVCVKVVESEL